MENVIQHLKFEIEIARSQENYQSIIDASNKILSIAAEHPELRIAEFIFFRKIAKAYEKLDDPQRAMDNYQCALESAKKLEKENPVDISKEILFFEARIKKLRAAIHKESK